MTDNNDGFFSNLENTKPYLKIAFEGFAGCGKTYTMAQLALGLHKRIGSTKPIVFFDTEKSAKFLLPFFRDAGVKALHKDSRSLADLKETMKRCRDGLSDILLIDSITHVWENFIESYRKEKNRKRLQFEDWGVLKPTWKREFSEPFVRDPYHSLMTGRAGYEYEDEKDEDGKRQIYKAGIKMKVEGETAYEPDLLVLMSRFEELLEDDKRVWREATIIKDRSTIIDGKTFKNPTYKDFAPAIDRILEEPVAREAAPERNAASLVDEGGNPSADPPWFVTLIADFGFVADEAALKAAQDKARNHAKQMSPTMKNRMTAASNAAKERIAATTNQNGFAPGNIADIASAFAGK
jgi:hypothetical protein